MSARCQLCGRQLSAEVQCSKGSPYVTDHLPAHCTGPRCHWDAVHVVEGEFVGPLLPPPWAMPAPDYRIEWERGDHGTPLEDVKR